MHHLGMPTAGLKLKARCRYDQVHEAYEVVSRQIGPALEHCVARLDPKAGEQILDLATGTGWTSRLAARRGASVVGADIASDLLAAANQRANKEGLSIEYRIGDAEKLSFADQSWRGVDIRRDVCRASRGRGGGTRPRLQTRRAHRARYLAARQ